MLSLVMLYSSGLQRLFKAADFIIPSHYKFLLGTYYAPVTVLAPEVYGVIQNTIPLL